MMSPFGNVLNTRESYCRFYQRKFTEVEVQFDNEDLKVVNMINRILSSKIRPAVMQDGGDVNFIKYKDGIAFLSLKGSCAVCPSATVTLKNGIETMLKNHIPELKKVEQVI